jgi:hypothetical protein
VLVASSAAWVSAECRSWCSVHLLVASGGREADRAQRPTLAHIQPALGTLPLEQNGQLPVLQRVKWMGDDQRTGRRPARPRIMFFRGEAWRARMPENSDFLWQYR